MATIQRRPGKTGVRYRVLIRRKGQAISETFPTKARAQAWAAKTEAALEGREFQDRGSLKGVLYGDLIDYFIRDRSRVGRGVPRDMAYALEQQRRGMGRTTLAALTHAAVRDWCLERLESVTGTTVARHLALLSSVLKNARGARDLPVDTTVPTRVRATLTGMGVDLSTGERDRTASEDEIARILAYLRQRGSRELADVCEVALGSAMRLGEIARIRWDDLDEANRKILVRNRKDPRRKQGNDQWAPLLPERITGHDALKVLLRQARTGEKVFRSSAHSLSNAWARAVTDMGIEDLRFHDLRHSALTRCAKAGFNLPRLRLVSGHKDFKMLSRYVNLEAEDVSLL